MSNVNFTYVSEYLNAEDEFTCQKGRGINPRNQGFALFFWWALFFFELDKIPNWEGDKKREHVHKFQFNVLYLQAGLEYIKKRINKQKNLRYLEPLENIL